MTRKDFVLIAEVLKLTQASMYTIVEMAERLKTANPAFDMARFIAACKGE